MEKNGNFWMLLGIPVFYYTVNKRVVYIMHQYSFNHKITFSLHRFNNFTFQNILVLFCFISFFLLVRYHHVFISQHLQKNKSNINYINTIYTFVFWYKIYNFLFRHRVNYLHATKKMPISELIYYYSSPQHMRIFYKNECSWFGLEILENCFKCKQHVFQWINNHIQLNCLSCNYSLFPLLKMPSLSSKHLSSIKHFV